MLYNIISFLWPYVFPKCLLYSFYNAFFNVFIYISITFPPPISLCPYKYSLGGFSIYIDDDLCSSQNIYVTSYVILFRLMDLSS